VLSKMIEALYLKVFVNIIVKRASTIVYIEIHSKKKVLNSIHSEFETTSLNDKMLAFIQKYIKESPYYYISILDRAVVQGALPSCQKQKMLFYKDMSDSEYRCYDGKWAYYTAKSEMYETEKIYESIGLDFIFSPFVLIAKFFKDKIVGKIAIYVLIEDNYLSIAVFEDEYLLYAKHCDLDTISEIDDILLSDNVDVDEELDFDDSGIDLESMDVDDDGIELEDFGEIEDLDSLEDIDEFDDSKDVEEELLESDTDLKEADVVDKSNEDYQRFSAIQSAVADYYKDERYESKFLENIYIADGIGVSRELKKYLEEEMFLNVYIRHMEIDVEICELAQEELSS